MPDKPSYRIGDAVVVKPGVMCPDKPNLSLAGWQGRVTALYPEEGTLELKWDSATLRLIPADYIRQSEIESLDWASMVLDSEEVAIAQPRDNPSEIEATYQQIADRHQWDHLADTNPGISEVLGGLEDDDMMSCLDAWEEHLTHALRFPFEAKIAEYSTSYPVRVGERVQLTGIAEADDLYGLLVNAKVGRKQYTLPMCDLEAADAASPNFQPLKDYVVWFANR